MKVINRPDTRWSHANDWEPKPSTAAREELGIADHPEVHTKTGRRIKAAIEAAYQEGQAKQKGNGARAPLSAIKTPFRDGDVKDQTILPMRTPTSSTPTPHRSRHRGRRPQSRLTRSEVIPRVRQGFPSPVPFNRNGNKGIASGLNNLQLIRPANPGGKASAEN
jgi:hypothetical protein